MLEKLFDVCMLDWNSVASQTSHSIPILTRPLILSEQSQVIFGTSCVSTQSCCPLLHELFAVSFSDCRLHKKEPTTLQWNGYVTPSAIDDITSIASDKIVAALKDSLSFFQVCNDQFVYLDSIEWTCKASVREMAYSAMDYTLWCAREDGSLGQYHTLSGKWVKWSPITDSFSSIRVESLSPNLITTTTDHGIFYAWDTRQGKEAFHWNAHRMEMFAHHVKRYQLLLHIYIYIYEICFGTFRNHVVIGYGDGSLSIWDMRYYSKNQIQDNHSSPPVVWIDTEMQAIGNMEYLESFPGWCLFGSSTSEVWGGLAVFHPEDTLSPNNNNRISNSVVATRLFQVDYRAEKGKYFYAMQGK